MKKRIYYMTVDKNEEFLTSQKRLGSNREKWSKELVQDDTDILNGAVALWKVIVRNMGDIPVRINKIDAPNLTIITNGESDKLYKLLFRRQHWLNSMKEADKVFEDTEVYFGNFNEEITISSLDEILEEWNSFKEDKKKDDNRKAVSSNNKKLSDEATNAIGNFKAFCYSKIAKNVMKDHLKKSIFKLADLGEYSELNDLLTTIISHSGYDMWSEGSSILYEKKSVTRYSDFDKNDFSDTCWVSDDNRYNERFETMLKDNLLSMQSIIWYKACGIAPDNKMLHGLTDVPDDFIEFDENDELGLKDIVIPQCSCSDYWWTTKILGDDDTDDDFE